MNNINPIHYRNYINNYIEHRVTRLNPWAVCLIHQLFLSTGLYDSTIDPNIEISFCEPNIVDTLISDIFDYLEIQQPYDKTVSLYHYPNGISDLSLFTNRLFEKRVKSNVIEFVFDNATSVKLFYNAEHKLVRVICNNKIQISCFYKNGILSAICGGECVGWGILKYEKC